MSNHENRIEQFVTKPESGLPVVYSGSYFTLLKESESSRAVGEFGARGSIVWLLAPEFLDGDSYHVLVDPDGGDEIEVLTAAIDKLAVARDQLARLRNAWQE